MRPKIRHCRSLKTVFERYSTLLCRPPYLDHVYQSSGAMNQQKMTFNVVFQLNNIVFQWFAFYCVQGRGTHTNAEIIKEI